MVKPFLERFQNNPFLLVEELQNRPFVRRAIENEDRQGPYVKVARNLLEQTDTQATEAFRILNDQFSEIDTNNDEFLSDAELEAAKNTIPELAQYQNAMDSIIRHNTGDFIFLHISDDPNAWNGMGRDDVSLALERLEGGTSYNDLVLQSSKLGPSTTTGPQI